MRRPTTEVETAFQEDRQAAAQLVGSRIALIERFRMPTFVDLFCGAGFGARGAVRGGGIPLLGLDSWSLATETYQANFPTADVLTERIEDVSLEELSKTYRPDVLLTSPECTSHSIARGAKPGLEASRETAISIVAWARALGPRWVIVENVNRMRKWERHDELVSSLESLGYTVSSMLLNAADFGSPQARRRMFLVCDKEGTEVEKKDLHDFANSRRMTARNIIDWSDRYKSSPLRKKGRAKATLERAERAIKELGKCVPFLIVYYGSDYAGGWQSIDAPLRTVTTVDRFGLVTWRGSTPYMRMLQPAELIAAMGGSTEHVLPYGNRREKVKLCGNGVCSDVVTAIFGWIVSQDARQSQAA